MNENNARAELAFWSESVLEVAENIIQTHNFNAPRVNLSLSFTMVMKQ